MLLQDTVIGDVTIEWPIKGKITPTFGNYYNSLFIDQERPIIQAMKYASPMLLA